jgi:serine/threonine-protein kinase mTOR
LSIDLIDSLSTIAESIPELLYIIQEKLLEIIHSILTKVTIQSKDLKVDPSIELNNKFIALKTISLFNMNGQVLVEYINDYVLKYLYDDNVNIRKEAALACCNRVLEVSEYVILFNLP